MPDQELRPVLEAIATALETINAHIRILSRRMTLCEDALERCNTTHEGHLCPINEAVKVYSEEVEGLRMAYDGYRGEMNNVAKMLRQNGMAVGKISRGTIGDVAETN